MRKFLYTLMTMFVAVAVNAQEVTLDFTTNTWELPTSGTNKAETSYTDGNYTIKLTAGTNYKWYSAGYLLLGKAGSTLELPAFDFPVGKIEVYGTTSASTSVKQNIFVGENIVSTETTGAKFTDPTKDCNTYQIASAYQAAGNIYKLTVASAHNTQISAIKVYKASAIAAPEFTPAAGTYYGPQQISLSCATSGAVLSFYIGDDEGNLNEYAGPFTINESCTVHATASLDGDKSTSSATYTIAPAYASLAELVAAGAPEATGKPVQLTLTNEKIQSIAKSAAGKSIGVYVKSGDQDVELYLSGVPAEWVENGKISGTVQGTWMLFNDVWELKLNTGAWDNLTYAEPVYAFTATENIGTKAEPVYKEIVNKFTKSPLTVMYKDDATGLTFKVNGVEKAYDAAKGLSLSHTAQKNDIDLVQVYNGETLVAEQSFTWIPTVNVSGYKKLEDGTEAVLTFNNGNKVTYTSSSEVFFEDASQAIEGYNLGLDPAPTAYKTISSGSIWGIKKTFNNIIEIAKADSTAAFSTLTQTETDVTPSALTVAATLSAANQLRYAKTSVMILKNGTQYKAVCGTDTVLIYDYLKTKVMAAVTEEKSFADLTYLVGVNASTGDIQYWPLAIENVSDKAQGVCGGVTWTIDPEGNMVFAPTDGVSGTLEATGVSTSKRPWSAYATSVKTVKFEPGVSATDENSYMFYQMANLESVDFTNFNTSAQTTMKGLFNGCTSLKTVDMSGLDLANVTNFNLTFNGCSALTSVNFGENTLAKVTNFGSMFYSCVALTDVDFAKVTGEAATDISSMFYDCTSLAKVDLRAFSTANVTKASKAKNVFGAKEYSALPTTLIISKNFGKIADGSYVTLPALDYMSDADNTQAFKLASGTIEVEQTALYAYNEGLADYGTYVPYKDIPDSISNVETTTEAKANGKFIENGKVVIVRNGQKYNAAGARMK